MSMFPGSSARIYRNEVGEPLGWDYSSEDPADHYDEMSALDMAYDDAYDDGRYDAENGEPYNENYSQKPKFQAAYKIGYDENKEEADGNS